MRAFVAILTWNLTEDIGCIKDLLLLEDTHDLVLELVREADGGRGQLLHNVLIAGAAPARVVVLVLQAGSFGYVGDEYLVVAGPARRVLVSDVCGTSSSSAVGTIPVAALNANADNLAVDILSVIGVDVAGATTAVRNLRSCHCKSA